MNVLPLFSRCATVVTIIDTQYFMNPRQFSFSRRSYLKHMMRKSLDKADGIITISHTVKKEINEYLPRNNHSDIKVVHLGIDPCFRIINDATKIEAMKRKYGIQGKYVLFPGYPHYRKNIPRLIQAFKKVLTMIPEPYTLVVSGEMGTDDSDLNNIRQTIDRLGVRDRVFFTGYVPGTCLPRDHHADYAILMNGANLLVYPSLYEGFGLPVAEAMACGLPVLTSNIPVMQEVAGNAAIFVDPYDVDDIARGIYLGLTAESLRRKIVLRGLERAKRFSWITSALRTREYYEDVFHRIRGREA
jgi:glycosyltransferase involved in cell wall biosynthesis